MRQEYDFDIKGRHDSRVTRIKGHAAPALPCGGALPPPKWKLSLLLWANVFLAVWASSAAGVMPGLMHGGWLQFEVCGVARGPFLFKLASLTL